MTRLRARRGNALIVTLVALSAMMVLALGTLSFTSRNWAAAASKERGDRLSACADTARRYLLSRLRVFGTTVPVTELVLEQAVQDDASPSLRSVMRTGHYGAPDGGVATVAEVPARAMGS